MTRRPMTAAIDARFERAVMIALTRWACDRATVDYNLERGSRRGFRSVVAVHLGTWCCSLYLLSFAGPYVLAGGGLFILLLDLLSARKFARWHRAAFGRYPWRTCQ